MYRMRRSENSAPDCLIFCALVIAMTVILSGCGGGSKADADNINPTIFSGQLLLQDDGQIANQYQCARTQSGISDFDNNPPVNIISTFPGTEYIAVIIDNPDKITDFLSPWVNWNIYFKGSDVGLPEYTQSISFGGTDPIIGPTAGRSTLDQLIPVINGYEAPCPAVDEKFTLRFAVFAMSYTFDRNLAATTTHDVDSFKRQFGAFILGEDITAFNAGPGVVPASAPPPAKFSFSSQSFSSGADIPVVHTCNGLNLSPQLSWQNPPDGTSSFAVIMDDENPPCGTGPNACRHWALLNIPGSITYLVSGANTSIEQSILSGSNISGLAVGNNYRSQAKYAGPCPPNRHSYVISIYALSMDMPVIENDSLITRSTFEEDYGRYILGAESITGWYQP